MANNRGLRKTIEALEKAVEALESQNFAQKLLIDEYEAKLKTLQRQVDQYTQPDPWWQQAIQPQQIQPAPLSTCNHNWVVDNAGTYCSLCGTRSVIVFSTGTNITVK